MTNDQLMSKIAEIEREQNDRHMDNISRLTKIETTLSSIYRRIFGGDGEKGIASVYDARITRLERMAYTAMAIVTLIEVLRVMRDFKLL
jgi:flagellin-specific chaperone FliS